MRKRNMIFLVGFTALTAAIHGCGSKANSNLQRGGATPPANPTAIDHRVLTIQIQPNPARGGATTFGASGNDPVTVTAGTTVTWVNQDSKPHTVTADEGIWDSGKLQPKQSFSYKFAKPGTYSYHCEVAGREVLSSAIQVNEDTGLTSTGGKAGSKPTQTGGTDPYYPDPYPTTEPTSYPTSGPSTCPTGVPTVVPTISPTPWPTTEPSPWPTTDPSPWPTTEPSPWPTTDPSPWPTTEPTSSPTTEPSPWPTTEPSPAPWPTVTPSVTPTSYPTHGPDPYPTRTPDPYPINLWR